MKSYRVIYGLLLALVLAMPVAAQEFKPLPETFVSEDERMTLRYPTGWLVTSEENGMVVIATDEALFDVADEVIPSGEAVVAILYSTIDDTFSRELFQGEDAEGVLGSVIKSIESSDTRLNLEEVYTTTFNDLPAARVDGSISDNDLFIMAVEHPDGIFSLVIGITAEDEMARYEPKLLGIAASVNYQPEA